MSDHEIKPLTSEAWDAFADRRAYRSGVATADLDRFGYAGRSPVGTPYATYPGTG